MLMKKSGFIVLVLLLIAILVVAWPIKTGTGTHGETFYKSLIYNATVYDGYTYEYIPAKDTSNKGELMIQCLCAQMNNMQ